MARETILVNLQRCTGCWSCALGCKMVNELADDEFRIMVKTVGNGHGTDRPAGVWPRLAMSWQPTWSSKCTGCAEGNTDHGMFCVYTCPSNALMHGAEADAEAERLSVEGFEVFELTGEEANGTRSGVKYARPAAVGAPSDWERFEIEEAEYVEDDGAFIPTLDATTIGELFENPATAGIMERLLPWLDITTEQGALSKGMTLAALAPFSQGLLDEETLSSIAGEFGKIAAGYFKVDETTIGELADNPVGASLLREFLPWLDLSTEQGAMSKGMTLAALAPLTQGLLDEDALAAIASRLAAYAPAPVFSVTEMTIGEIVEDSRGAAILAKHIPWLDTTTPEGSMSKGMTLAALAPFSQGLLDDDGLAAIAADFAKLAKGIMDEPEAARDAAEEVDVDSPGASAVRPAGGYTLDTKIRDLEKDPEAWAILAKFMPEFTIGSKEAKQAGGMSIRSIARFAKDILTPEVLAEIEAGFEALGGGDAPAEKPKRKGFFKRLFGR